MYELGHCPLADCRDDVLLVSTPREALVEFVLPPLRYTKYPVGLPDAGFHVTVNPPPPEVSETVTPDAALGVTVVSIYAVHVAEFPDVTLNGSCAYAYHVVPFKSAVCV